VCLVQATRYSSTLCCDHLSRRSSTHPPTRAVAWPASLHFSGTAWIADSWGSDFIWPKPCLESAQDSARAWPGPLVHLPCWISPDRNPWWLWHVFTRKSLTGNSLAESCLLLVCLLDRVGTCRPAYNASTLRQTCAWQVTEDHESRSGRAPMPSLHSECHGAADGTTGSRCTTALHDIACHLTSIRCKERADGINVHRKNTGTEHRPDVDRCSDVKDAVTWHTAVGSLCHRVTRVGVRPVRARSHRCNGQRKVRVSWWHSNGFAVKRTAQCWWTARLWLSCWKGSSLAYNRRSCLAVVATVPM